MVEWNPSDLDGRTAEYVAQELFGETLDDPWWSLERDGAAFVWTENRLMLKLKATQGYLIGLQEVSTAAQAKIFATRNSIKLFPSGGILVKGVAELFLRCNGLAPPEMVTKDTHLFRITTTTGVSASVGYGSRLFRRLVAGPCAEEIQGFPDIATITTMAFHPADSADVHQVAETLLFHLRRTYPGVSFKFCELQNIGHEPLLEPAENAPAEPEAIAGLREAANAEALAFYNRATEGEPIQAFLYFYRVLEACFDAVLHDTVSTWRADQKLTTGALLKKFRQLQQREDIWSLRKVLAHIVDQLFLDQAHEKGLIPTATSDALAQAIYSRRNSVAHGRRGAHTEVLVPYGFAPSLESNHVDWRDVMTQLAEKALEKWILRN
ncbi:MAG: hypothetical protein WDO69_23475 [Pseudomonadota bacterium]